MHRLTPVLVISLLLTSVLFGTFMILVRGACAATPPFMDRSNSEPYPNP